MHTQMELRNDDALRETTVKHTQSSLSAQELEQANELLTWIVNRRDTFNTEQASAIMWKKMKRGTFYSIEKKVKDQFFKLFDFNNSGHIVLKESSRRDYFRKSPRLKQAKYDGPAGNEARISMQITIFNVRVSQVQRFF